MSITNPTCDCAECKLGEEMNYQAYKAHREDFPHIAYAHWASLFRDVERWEKRYQWEKFHEAPVKPGIWQSPKELLSDVGFWTALAFCVLVWWVVIAAGIKLWPR